MNPTPTLELRAKLRELHAAATQGEWMPSGDKFGAGVNLGECYVHRVTIGECYSTSDEIFDPNGEPEKRNENLALIVAAHNALPGLLDALDAADRKIADLRKEVGRVAPQEMSNWESGLIAREDSEVQEALAAIRRLRAEIARLKAGGCEAEGVQPQPK